MPEAHGLPYRLVNVPIKDSPLSDCGGLCGDLDVQIKLEDDVSLLLDDLNVSDHFTIINHAYSI